MADKPKPLRVRVTFVGAAADGIRELHRRGLHGPTLQLVVEGLALESLRRVAFNRRGRRRG